MNFSEKMYMLILFGILIRSPLFAQYFLFKKRLLFSPSEIAMSRNDSLYAKKIRLKKSNILIYYRNGSKISVPYDSVWGYQEKNGNIFRIYAKEIYKIEKTGKLIIYNRDIGGNDSDMHYYFSFDLDSKMYSVDFETIIRLFEYNKCLLRKFEELKWYEAVDEWDDDAKVLKFETWYDECVKN